MLLAAILALTTTLAACGAWRSGAKYEGERFRGNVEAVDLGCWADAICTLTVSGKKVTFGRGWSGGPWGELVGFDPSDPSTIGRAVEVFADRYDEASYTLEGDDAYYVRALD